MSQLILNAQALVALQAEWTAQWHEGPTPPQAQLPWSAIERNHRMNFTLWHEEDIARRDDLGAERVRQAKREIDRCNQSRNDAIEQTDLWLLQRLLPLPQTAPQHSETPGMIIDRLSILSLKLFHMRLEAERASATSEHRLKCREKHSVLEEQWRDLTSCLASLLAELSAGTRRFKLYRQLKMYNDPSMNPQLYGGTKPG
jgi:hypothetical protein